MGVQRRAHLWTLSSLAVWLWTSSFPSLSFWFLTRKMKLTLKCLQHYFARGKPGEAKRWGRGQGEGVAAGSGAQSHLPPHTFPLTVPDLGWPAVCAYWVGPIPMPGPAKLSRGPLSPNACRGPWPLVLGVGADWILSWQPHRCCTSARVAGPAGREKLVLPPPPPPGLPEGCPRRYLWC